MKTQDAIKHYHSQAALAQALGIKGPSVSGWGERVPWRRQLELERLTGGALKHCPDDIPPELRGMLVPGLSAAPSKAEAA